MSSQSAPRVDIDVALLPGHGPRPVLGLLYDQHGAPLYRLALTVSLSVETACWAVVEAFDMALTDRKRHHGDRLRFELARSTYLACTFRSSVSPPPHPSSGDSWTGDACVRSLGPRARALLALTMHGDHTYREAALLVHAEPETARREVREALLAVARGVAGV